MAVSLRIASVFGVVLFCVAGSAAFEGGHSAFREALDALDRLHITSSRLSGKVSTLRQETSGDVVDVELQKLIAQGSGGANVLVSINGTIVKEQSYGLADVENNLPMMATSRTNIASVTKQFTAFMMVLLAHKGEISLDDDVRMYVPELPDYGSTIQLRHMIAMTSGIRDIFVLLGLGSGELSAPVPRERLIKIITSQENVRFAPGDRWEYSNSNYVLMSLIVERVTRLSFRDALQENIFIPLGMTETSLYDDPTRIFSNLTQSYALALDIETPGEAPVISVGNSKWLLSGIGTTGIITTPTDLLKWAQNFENNVLGGGQGLIEEMETPYVFANVSDVTYAQGGQYAKGIFVRNLNNITIFEHTGSIAGYRTVLVRIPELKAVIIVQATTSVLIDPLGLVQKITVSIFPSLAPQDSSGVDDSPADMDDETDVSGDDLDMADGSAEPEESPEDGGEDDLAPEVEIAALSPRAYSQKAGVWSLFDGESELLFDMITNCTADDPSETECKLLLSLGIYSETYLRPESELVWVGKLFGQERAVSVTFDQPQTSSAVISLFLPDAGITEPLEVLVSRDPLLQLTTEEFRMFEGLYYSKELDTVYRAARVGNGLDFGPNAGIVAQTAASYLPCCAGSGFSGTFMNARPSPISSLESGIRTVSILQFSQTSREVELSIGSSAPRSNFNGIVFRNFDTCAAGSG